MSDQRPGPLWETTHDEQQPLPDRERLLLTVTAAVGVGIILVLAIFFVVSAGDTPKPSNLATDGQRTISPSPSTSAPSPSPSRTTRKPSPTPIQTPGPLNGRAYAGPLVSVPVEGADAKCVANPSADSSGQLFSYGPDQAVDGIKNTAWRCNGDGVGEKLRLLLVKPVRLAAVAIVPGYAKTDPASGIDRYAQNRRLTRVRWQFGGGRYVDQTLDPSPSSRALQVKRIPPVVTSKVTLKILASTPPTDRDDVAVSTVRLSTAGG
jgi:hypothetical protein